MAVYGTGTNVHIDKVLTNISLGYQNNAFVAQVLFPQVSVAKQSDLYYTYGYEAWTQPVGGDSRAPGTEANEVPGLAVSTGSYFATEHSLQIAVTDEERQNADTPLAPDRDGTELITQQLHLEREKAVVDMVTSTSNFPSGSHTTLSGTAQWSDLDDSDPIADVRTGTRTVMGLLFKEPNLAVIPYKVMSYLEDNDKIINRIKYSMPGVLTADLIAGVLSIAKVVVPGAGYNTANPGQTTSLSYLWGNDVLMAYVPERAGLKIPAFGYEFVWGYPSGGAQVVERWREEPRKSDVVRVSRRYDHKLIATNSAGTSIAGYLIKAAIA